LTLLPKRARLASVCFLVILLLNTVFVGFAPLIRADSTSTSSPSGYNVEYNLSYNGTAFDLYYPISGSNFPLIVYSTGTGGGDDAQTSNAIYFAENGYACLWYATAGSYADTYEPASESNCLALLPMIFNSTAMNSVCGISINESAVALTGWSGGGGAMLAINDTRVRTIVAYCPYYDETCLPAVNTCPVLICCGQNDTQAPIDTNGLVFYNGDVESKMILEMAGGVHSVYNGWNYSVAWLNWVLQGNSSALAFVLGISGDPSISFYLQDLSPSDFSLPTPAPTPAPTPTPTPTLTPTPSATLSPISTPTPAPTLTPSPTPTATLTPTTTPYPIPSQTPSPTPSSSSLSRFTIEFSSLIVILTIFIAVSLSTAIAVTIRKRNTILKRTQ